MAACITIWRGVTKISSSARYADLYSYKVGGSSMMRQNARIGNGCINMSKLTLTPMVKLQKVDSQSRRGLCVTSAGFSDKFVAEEPSDDIQNTEELETAIDQTLGTKSSVYKTSLTAHDRTDDEEISESMMVADGYDLIPWLDCSDEAITKEVSATSSSESSSFGPLRSPTSRMMIQVIDKLLKILHENLELATTQLQKCPKLDLIFAIILILLWLIWRYLLILPQIRNRYIP